MSDKYIKFKRCPTGGWNIYYVHTDGDLSHVGWAATMSEARDEVAHVSEGGRYTHTSGQVGK